MPGAGAFEIAAHAALIKYKDTVKGKARLGTITLHGCVSCSCIMLC